MSDVTVDVPPPAVPSRGFHVPVNADPISISNLFLDVLNAAQSDMLDPTRQAIGKYVDLLNDVRELAAMFRPNTSAGSDSNHIKVNVKAIKAELEKLKAKWGGVNVFGPADLSLVKRLAQEWHLPFEQTSANEGVIKVDIGPIDAMLKATDATPDAKGDVDWLFGEYQAWNTAMTEQRTQIENENTLLSELARNALATFNNIVSIISSLIQALSDCVKQSARAIG